MKKQKYHLCLLYILASVILVIEAYPIIWTFLTSFKTQDEIRWSSSVALPQSLNFDNYIHGSFRIPTASIFPQQYYCHVSDHFPSDHSCFNQWFCTAETAFSRAGSGSWLFYGWYYYPNSCYSDSSVSDLPPNRAFKYSFFFDSSSDWI